MFPSVVKIFRVCSIVFHFSTMVLKQLVAYGAVAKRKKYSHLNGRHAVVLVFNICHYLVPITSTVSKLKMHFWWLRSVTDAQRIHLLVSQHQLFVDRPMFTLCLLFSRSKGIRNFLSGWNFH